MAHSEKKSASPPSSSHDKPSTPKPESKDVAPKKQEASKHESQKGKLAAARVLGAGCAGIAEIFTFHPIDTSL